MSILMVNEEVNFNDLKQLLEVTDGNLASHLITLEENSYIKVHKGFIGRKTNTTYLTFVIFCIQKFTIEHNRDSQALGSGFDRIR